MRNQQNQLYSTYGISEFSFLEQFDALPTEGTMGFGSRNLLTVSIRHTLQAADVHARRFQESYSSGKKELGRIDSSI